MHDDRCAKRDLGRFGLLQMTSSADSATGAVRYWFTAPHMRGSVVLVPALLFADPTRPEKCPCDLYIFARLDGPGRPERPLTVNGIELVGRSAVRTDALDQIKTFRLGKTGVPEQLPPRSRLLARAVLGAAAEHWSKRSDRDVLDALAVRSTAQHFLGRYEAELERREEAVRRAQQALADTRLRLSTLRGLIESAEAVSR
ncbi:hypothetical protein ACGRHY_28035 [Streptomyces sp. HK10]|uniref:hypothetical protein n=1 Tax=Streptomyces sp. HK10 TaxID=3373255 RepID=UPI0037486B3C